MRTTALALLCATLVLAACGTEQSATDPEGSGETVPSSESPEPSAGSGSPAVEKAMADLARRLDVAADEIAVDSEEAVTWNDGSLGCAEKGMMYTQALVEGSRIVLSVDGTTYEYHSGGNREPFLCENPTQ